MGITPTNFDFNKGAIDIKVDIQFAKRRLNFDINLTKSNKNPNINDPRFWSEEPTSISWDVNTFRNTTEQL